MGNLEPRTYRMLCASCGDYIIFWGTVLVYVLVPVRVFGGVRRVIQFLKRPTVRRQTDSRSENLIVDLNQIVDLKIILNFSILMVS